MLVVSAETGAAGLLGDGVGRAAGGPTAEPELALRPTGRQKWGPASFTPAAAAPSPVPISAPSTSGRFPGLQRFNHIHLNLKAHTPDAHNNEQHILKMMLPM